MARPTKQGIDYFPLDVGFLRDIKVRKIIRACGLESISVLIDLLGSCYREEGYYLRWDDDQAFLTADDVSTGEVGISEDAVREIVAKAVQVGFFNSGMWKHKQVLTSAGIQKRYFEAVSRRKKIGPLRRDILLVDVNVYINPAQVEFMSTETPQNEGLCIRKSTKESKVKESKVKKSRVEKRESKELCHREKEHSLRTTSPTHAPSSSDASSVVVHNRHTESDSIGHPMDEGLQNRHDGEGHSADKGQQDCETGNPQTGKARPKDAAEVTAYFNGQGYLFNHRQEAKTFFDYYEANGWRVNRNPMKDWQAAARNWARRRAQWQSKGSRSKGWTLLDYERAFEDMNEKEDVDDGQSKGDYRDVRPV